ncbi:MAG: GntR family transcriptional regulator [Oscillospiraceae bacterium]|nr:GntR family transcriptional regulator [Oscillospiraceae bacterium]
MVHLDYRDARPIYAQIIDGIKAQISSGVLDAGEKLPSVRELAAELAINPNTIQRSYRRLELEGWIATVPGKGCFVCDVPEKVGREREQWYAAFDEATTSLLALGITRDQLIARIERGGSKHA